MSTTTERHLPAARKPRVALRLILMLLFLGLVGGGLVGFHIFKAHILEGVVATIVAQLPTVATVTATSQSWQPVLSGNGSLRASQGADLSAEVGGIVGELHFVSGDTVKAGTLLLRLRPNDDDAKLAQLQATAELDAITYQRDLKQLRAQGVAQSTVDTDLGTLKNAQAQVAGQQAVIAEKFVRAPFTGRLGLRQVDLGQYLSPGTKIVTLQALDPMFLDFYLPQQTIGAVRVDQAVTVQVDALPGRDFPGRVNAINSQVDSSSRMVQIRATLGNPDQVLLPGMFATVSIATGATQPHVTIPLTSVSFNPYGSLVYRLEPDGTQADGKPKFIAKQIFVTTGETRGGQVQILTGVDAGDMVVSAGQLKLHNDSQVLVNNAVQPSDDPNPKLVDQ